MLTTLATIEPGVTEITFRAGGGIDMIMVGDPTKNQVNWWRPSYGFPGADIIMPVTEGERIIVSVTPKPGYKLGSWTKIGEGAQTWIANGVSGTYKNMSSVTHSECIAAGKEGMNVTDGRDGTSYTIGKFENRCWMFSNLRLKPGATITPSDSDVTSDFTLPTQSDSDVWTSDAQNYYAKKNIKACRGVAGYTSSGYGNSCKDQDYGVTEYYYNWYTATANDAVGIEAASSGQAIESLDDQSKGSICPKNWYLHRMPSGNDNITSLMKIWNADKTNNLGRLIASGYFFSGTQKDVGRQGTWWSNNRNNDDLAWRFTLSSGGANGGYNFKYFGNSVRCEL